MGSITMALAGLDCSENCAGGISKIYVANAGDIDSVVKDVDGAVTSIVMVATITYFEQIRERFYTPFFYGLFCAILYKTNKIKYNFILYIR